VSSFQPTEQIVIDELSSHTDTNRQQLIHPYKTIYGRNLNNVLKDNLGNIWSEACSTLMCEMRMYELECLRRRMEDEMVAAQQAAEVLSGSLMSPMSPASVKSAGSQGTSRGPHQEDQFTGISCLLITWKSNTEVEQFKDLYLSDLLKDKKKRPKLKMTLPEMVSEDSLKKHYRVLGKGDGIERLLIKGKKEQLEEVDGDPYKYFLLAGRKSIAVSVLYRYKPFWLDSWYSNGLKFSSRALPVFADTPSL